jgi:hypothetical protein
MAEEALADETPAEAKVERNSPEVEALIRQFEAAHTTFVETEPRHRDVIGYHRMRAKFSQDLREAVARQHAPPEPDEEGVKPAEAEKE